MNRVKLGSVLNIKRGTSLSGKYYAERGEKVRLTLGNFNYPNGGFKENTSKTDIYFTGDVKPEFILKKGDIITPLTEQVSGLLGETARIPVDNMYIQSGDIEYINRRRKRDGQKALEPIYEIEDVEKAMKLFAPVAVNKRFHYDDEISFEFTDAGHILGSVSVHLFITEKGNTKQITFSGDVGRFNDLILKAPASFSQADLIDLLLVCLIQFFCLRGDQRQYCV